MPTIWRNRCKHVRPLREGGQAPTFIVVDQNEANPKDRVLKRLKNPSPARHGRFEQEIKAIGGGERPVSNDLEVWLPATPPTIRQIAVRHETAKGSYSQAEVHESHRCGDQSDPFAMRLHARRMTIEWSAGIGGRAHKRPMHEILKATRDALEHYLSDRLPRLDANWWSAHVVARLSFSQQRIVEDKQLRSLAELDLAALLRVLDQNWYELSQTERLAKEARNWVKELQSIRNGWAHRGRSGVRPSEMYRELDTVGRLLTALGIDGPLATIEAKKAEALRDLTPAAPAAAPPQRTTLFDVGDVVCLRSNPATALAVIEVLLGPGDTRYRVLENGVRTTYYESQLQTVGTAEMLDRLSASEMRAYLTSLHLSPPSSAHLYSLRAGRVNFVPYQYRPVLKLMRADQPRLLIADEVGVGKTIEAALILKELRARGSVARVLVICPKALVAERKWERELKRFDEHFRPLDGDTLRHCLEETSADGEWPADYARAILPMSLLDRELLEGRAERGRRRIPGLRDLDVAPKFDLIIVDEAHNLRNPETFAHQAVRIFCDNAEAAVFLTATPVQLGSDDLFTILNMLRPDLVIDKASYDQMSEPNRFLHEAVRECRSANPGWTARVREFLDLAAQTDWGRTFLREKPEFQRAYDDAREPDVSDATRVSLIRTIEELGTFSTLINRTRRRDIGGDFTTRKARTIRVDFTAEQRAFHDQLLSTVARILAARHGDINVKFMLTTIRRQAASCLFGLTPLLDDILRRSVDRLEILEAADDERGIDAELAGDLHDEIASIREQATRLDPTDPKLDAFVRAIREKQQLPKNKALVFSTFRHTLAYLARGLNAANIRFGLVHGDVPDEERAELRKRFAKPREDSDALDILLSSEVGSEGLDFQFCDCIVNYDLPWNPMKIEQRIGRLDRYGQQSESIEILNLITPDTVDAEIYERCLLRIGIFEHAIGGHEEILGELTTRLHDIAERFDLTQDERARKLAQLADNEIRRIQEQQELEAKQSELFGLDIAQQWQEDVEDADSAWLRPAAVEQLVVEYLARRLQAPHDVLLGEGPLKTLRLNQDARASLLGDLRRTVPATVSVAREWDRWLRGTTPTLPVTFEQGIATENPAVAYFSLTHPLVRQATGFFARSDAAETRLTVVDEELGDRTHRFAIYRWTFHGVRPDERLVVVSDDGAIDDFILGLLSRATDDEAPAGSARDYADLDARHHEKWSRALAEHVASNRQTVEYRIQSLQASHAARRRLIGEQATRSANEKIQVMKRSELERLETDFRARIEDLERTASAGDIYATPVLFGVLRTKGTA